MKLLLVLVLILVSACRANDEDEKMKILLAKQQECAVETGIPPELFVKVLARKFEDNPIVKKHLFCVAKKIKFQNEAGELQIPVIREKMATFVKDPAKLEELIGKCCVPQATPEETAFFAISCYMKAKYGS